MVVAKLRENVLFAMILGYFCFAVYSNKVDYGKFNLHVDKFVMCKGPKRKDCSIINAKVLDNRSIYYDIVVTENMKPTKVKIVAMSNGKLLVRLQADNPCSHLFLLPLLKSMLNVTDNCIIAKGHYTFNIDLEKIAKTYYQGSFLLGNLTFKAVFYNNDCNLSCTVVEVTFKDSSKLH